MNQILVLKNLALNEGTPSNVAAVKDIVNLKPGAVALVVDGKTLYEAGKTWSALERVQLVAGITKGVNTVGNEIYVQSSVPIARRQVLSVNYEKYVAPITKVVELGPFNWKDEGDAGILIMDSSYVRTIQTNEIRISEYKLANMTPESIINKIVDRINNGTGIPNLQKFNAFCTAVKKGTTPADFKIELTMKTEHVDLAVSLNGMFAYAPVVVTREPVISLGKGEDVLRTEKEFNGNLGDGGYWGYNEGYFSKPLEADIATNYDIFQIKFQGEHDTPQNRVRTAVNHLTVAVPTGSTLVGTLKTAFDELFATAYDSVKGSVVPSKDEEKETDKTPKVIPPAT